MRPVTRIVLYSFLTLAVGIGGFFVYAGWYLQSSNFPQLIERHLSDATGYQWELAGDLNLSIVPLAIEASDVRIVDPVTNKAIVTVGGVQSSVDIPTLFSGKVLINHVSLQDLMIVLSQEMLADEKSTTEDVTNVDIQFSMGDMVGGFDLEGVDIQRGSVVWERETERGREYVTANDIDIKIKLADTTKFVISCGVDSNILPTQGRLSAFGEVDATLKSFDLRTIKTQIDWNGEIELEGRAVTTALSAQCAVDWAKRELTLSDVKAEVDKGKLDFSGRMTDISNENWKLTGQAVVQDLSLSYWFGFTENLPTSLNHALDAIDGVLSIEMTKDHVWSENLRAEVLGMKLSGVGGVKDFSAPVIFIDAHGEDIDVNRVFPEIGLTPPDVLPKPSNPAPPIFRFNYDKPEDAAKTPAEANDEALDDFTVGYDIRVGAKRVTAHGFAINDLQFRCWPAPNQDTLTSYKIGNAYGGSVDSVLTIANDLRLDATFKGVQTEEISRILTGDSVIAGVADGTIDVRADARTVYGLVAGLGGKVNAVFRNGYVKSLPSKQPNGTISSSQNFFDELKIDLTGKSLMKSPDTAGFDLLYNWDLSVFFKGKDTEESYLTKIKGPILMNAKRVLPVRGNNVDLDFTWYGSMDVNKNPVPIAARLVSKLTYDLEAETLAIRNGMFTFDNQRFRVQADGNQFINAPEFKGSFDGEEFDLRPLLRTMNLLRWEPRDTVALTRASLKGDFDLREGRYALYNVVGYVDDSALRGSVLVNLNSTIPTIRADASLGEVLLHRYFPPETVDVRSKVFNKRDWDLTWLKEFDIKGSLKVDALRFKRLDIQKLVTPVTIGEGVIQVGPLEANLYNGSLSGEFKGTLQEKLESKLVGNMNGVDMALASKGAVGEDYLGGLATGYVEARGSLGSSFDILGSLDGIWGIAIKDGFFGFSKNKKGEIEKTTFSSAVSDGSIKQGVMSSKNFAVKSSFVEMSGGGNVDLVQKNIDYQVSVTYARIPTVPVTIKGHWDDPKVTVDGLSVVPRTVGKIGGGVFSILKDAVLIPFRAIDLLPSIR